MPPLTERSADSVNGVAEAAGLFNEKEYEQALPLLHKELSSQPNDMFLLFFRGVTIIHTGQATQARTDLEHVYERKSVCRYEAAYLMGVSKQIENANENCR